MNAQRRAHLISVGLFLVGAASPSFANEQRVATKYRALVMGNSAYLPDKLRGPVNDAQDMAAALVGIGFTVVNASGMTDLTRSEMLDAIERFMLDVDRDTVAVVYYSGHGVEDSNTNYLVPVGSVLKNYADIETQLVSLDGILKRFDQREASTRVVILDACRDLPLALKYTKSFGEKGGLAAVKELRPGTSIIYATSPNKIAIAATQSQRNSVFTAALLEAIKQKPPTFLELLVTAAKTTYEITGKKQSPWLSGELQMAAFQLHGAGQHVSVNPLSQPSAEPIGSTPENVLISPSSNCTEISEQMVKNGISTWRKKCL